MPSSPQTFRQYIMKEADNRRYLKIAAAGLILQLVIFKILYPFGDYFSDSYSYLYAAITKMKVNLWPIGYTYFLRLFHHISHSDTALVAFQYLLAQCSALYLFFTAGYLFQMSEQVRKVVFYVLVFNPLILYICNYISSDGLFLALSLIWFTQLLWLIYRPTLWLILAHTVIIAIAFTVRYNAMYYPLITALALVLSSQKIYYKILGIILPLVLIYSFVNFTSEESRKITGTRQFSVFGGWQMANNALYMFPHLKEFPEPPADCKAFHQEVVYFFTRVAAHTMPVSPIDGAVYLKHPNAPLKHYMAKQYGTKTDSTGGIQSWGSVSPIYAEYGSYMIRQHPFYFARYFLLPNTFNYFIPPLEKLTEYNLGTDEAAPVAIFWFNYSSKKLSAVSLNGQKGLLFFFPILFGLLNLLFIWIIIRWLISKAYKEANISTKKALWLVLATLLVNAGFSILASPIVFRYQVFAMIICLVFIGVLLDKLKQELQLT
ncbi:hypothetical protein [Chitinophaga flava]|uniref:Glycosyltransferase RgtA/B/C/D-like domain-containing protein n=1 Tax=Chitinophaga flava TaxID=2259036 RepID=A0A365XRZ9_9BACT|nr:hypothetical protein [Chitinophaga flava]RBL89103.1 hypothetical protein DF182_21445 [Chitinophaga flava]